jgi:hypothetical protein
MAAHALRVTLLLLASAIATATLYYRGALTRSSPAPEEHLRSSKRSTAKNAKDPKQVPFPGSWISADPQEFLIPTEAPTFLESSLMPMKKGVLTL